MIKRSFIQIVITIILIGFKLRAEEVSLIRTVGYISAVSGTPAPELFQKGHKIGRLALGQKLSNIDEFVLDKNSRVTIIYCDGTVQSISGVDKWRGESSFSFPSQNSRGYGERLGKVFDSFQRAEKRGAGARGGNSSDPLTIVCATLNENSGADTGSKNLSGIIFWSEHSASPSNQIRLLLWRNSTLLTNITLKGSLVGDYSHLKLFRAQFLVPIQLTNEISEIQIGDSAFRGLGNSKSVSWLSLWPEPPLKKNSFSNTLDFASADECMANAICIEMSNQLAPALDVYLKLAKTFPNDRPIQLMLSRFFSDCEMAELADCYAEGGSLMKKQP